jgi:hypothetical protein
MPDIVFWIPTSSVHDFITDADYPIETYLKKSCPRQAGELCSKSRKIPTTKKKINVAKKPIFVIRMIIV